MVMVCKQTVPGYIVFQKEANSKLLQLKIVFYVLLRLVLMK